MANFGTTISTTSPTDTTKISIQNLKFALTTGAAEIAEVLLYDRVLGSLEIQYLEGYLAWKWGLQASLAAGHPYKTVPPRPNGSSYIGSKDMCPAYSTAGLGVRYLPQPKTFPCPNYIPGGVAWFDMNVIRSLTTGAVVSKKITVSGATRYVAETTISSMSSNFSETFFLSNNLSPTTGAVTATSFTLVDNTLNDTIGVTILTTGTGLGPGMSVLRVPSTTALQLSLTKPLPYYLVVYLARWSTAGSSGSIFLDNSTGNVQTSTTDPTQIGFTRNTLFGFKTGNIVGQYQIDSSVVGGTLQSGGYYNSTASTRILTPYTGDVITGNPWKIHAFQYHPNRTCTVRVNGIKSTPVAYTGGDGGLYGFNANLDTTTLDLLTSTSAGASTQGCSFDLAELMIYTDSVATPIKDSDVQRIEGYLAWKWGLQSSTTPTFLPSDHMYHATGPPPGSFDPGYCST